MSQSLKLPRQITDFFQFKKAMIIDPSESNRAATMKLLLELGFSHNSITSLKSIDRAKSVLKQRRPNLIITEMSFGEKETLQLLRDQKSLFRNDRDRIAIVVTGNNSEASVASAAEEEIDCFLVKPYSNKQLLAYLMKSVISKMAPNPYLDKIEIGRDELANDDCEAALTHFEEAVGLNEAPAMAHYYCAEALSILGRLDEAGEHLKKGLAINPIHYRCLTGYLDLMIKEKNMNEAYESLKKIFNHFPVSPQRLQQLVELASATDKYEDILAYHDAFVSLDEREPELVKVMAAGLMDCGKCLILMGRREEALEAFSRGLAVVGRNKGYIFECAEFLVRCSLLTEARELLEKCPPSAQESEEFLNLAFQIDSMQLSDSQFIEAGRRLIKEGRASLPTFKMTIERLRKLKLVRALDDVVYQAIEKYPDERQEILKIAA